MHKRRTTPAVLLCALPALMLAACQSEPPAKSDREAASSASEALTHGAELPARYERFVAWGEGDDELRLHRGGLQDPTRGPNSVAVSPTGAALILDQISGRVVAVGTDAKPVTVAKVPIDSIELVAGADGSFAAWSKARARAWVHAADGSLLGDMAVPRSFMFVQRLGLGSSGTLSVISDGQDIVELGSPIAPVPEITARKARRHGAALLPDGRGVFAHVEDSHAEVLVLDQPDRELDRPRVHTKHEIPGKVTAARIVGAFETTTCLRIEMVRSQPEIAVDRRALCLDATSGRVLLDEALPPPGIYGPHTELAMSGGRMAFVRPDGEGMRVIGWRVPVADEEVQP